MTYTKNSVKVSTTKSRQLTTQSNGGDTCPRDCLTRLILNLFYEGEANKSTRFSIIKLSVLESRKGSSTIDWLPVVELLFQLIF